jgi:hypothetical protein
VKRSEKMFILFRFEAKQSKKRLVSFALQRNKKIGSEINKFWKQNKVKIRCIDFALIGREKFEVKRSDNIFFFWCEHAKRISFHFVSL